MLDEIETKTIHKDEEGDRSTESTDFSRVSRAKESPSFKITPHRKIARIS